MSNAGWTYDAAGNLTTDGTATYAYDALGRLTGTTADSDNRDYAYDGDGTLVSATVDGTSTTYTQDLAGSLSQILASATGGTTSEYLRDHGGILLANVTGSTRTWYGTDTQGSERQTIDDGGNVLASQSYDPYGTPETSGQVSIFGYGGELQDGTTNAEYLRARWYQPGTGTLLGVDPEVDATGQAYAYAADDPVNGRDPNGQCTLVNGSQTLNLAGMLGAGDCLDYIDTGVIQQGGAAGQALRNGVDEDTFNNEVGQDLYDLYTGQFNGNLDLSTDQISGTAGEYDVLGQVSETQKQQLGAADLSDIEHWQAENNPGAIESQRVDAPTKGKTGLFLGICLGIAGMVASHPLVALGIMIVAGVIVIGIIVYKKTHPSPTPAPPTPVPTSTPNEPHWVVRAGIAKPEDLQKGYQEHQAVPGVHGLSVQYNPGSTVDGLAQAGRFSNKQISYATESTLAAVAASLNYQIRLISTPGRGYHHTLSVFASSGQPLTSLPGDLAEAFSSAFTRKPNPFPVPR